MCPTGGMDKTVLEGLASGTLAVVANEAFSDLFGKYSSELLYPYQKHEALAEKIKKLFKKNTEELITIREYLHKQMKNHSSLKTRIPIIVNTLRSL